MFMQLDNSAFIDILHCQKAYRPYKLESEVVCKRVICLAVCLVQVVLGIKVQAMVCHRIENIGRVETCALVMSQAPVTVVDLQTYKMCLPSAHRPLVYYWCETLHTIS